MLQINCMEYNKQMHAKKVELEEKNTQYIKPAL